MQDLDVAAFVKFSECSVAIHFGTSCHSACQLSVVKRMPSVASQSSSRAKGIPSTEVAEQEPTVPNSTIERTTSTSRELKVQTTNVGLERNYWNLCVRLEPSEPVHPLAL